MHDPVPVKSVEASPGHRVLEYRCEVCGVYAVLGFNANLREALRTGDVTKAGQWYCGEHAPKADAEG